MLSQSLAVLVAAATVSLAKTPSGFEPASDTDLIVEFSNIAALNGAVISKEASASEPQIGTTTQLTGTSYAIMMIDLDIPTNMTGTTSTLLHWMQTGLTPATTATALNMTSGSENVFLLQNMGNTPALAPYFGPSPPARTPLSHRYTQILVDTSAISTQATGALQNAAANRRGFDAPMVLQQAGLENKVVAGNFFVVMNPGPAQDGNGNSNQTGSDTSSPSPSSSIEPSGAGIISQPGTAILCLVAAGAVFLGL